MNVSLGWIRALAPEFTATAEQAAERLALLGFPVEEIHPLAEGLDDIVVARVLDVRPHPGADRLRICQVDGGAGVVQVVCGAPNVQAGGWYPLAPVGAGLPGGIQIRQANLRPEVSEGMLCSERELGLGRGQDGLMELSLGSEGCPPGTPLIEALSLRDVRLNVEVTSNRPDLYAHLGIARELAPRGQDSLVVAPFPGESMEVAEAVARLPLASEEGEVVADGVTLRVEASDLCPRYLGLVIRGVRVGPSPAWLQARLRAAGARPINNVVDATNFVLLELGQPLHAFDLDRLGGRTVVVRRGREGEGIRTLDGQDRVLPPGGLAICDSNRPVAVAGVMGGEESEVTAQTTQLFLECALFTPGPIRATRKALGLTTDASVRFERGVDPAGLRTALDRCARLILAIAGGTPGEVVLDVGTERWAGRTLELRPARVERLLGVSFSSSALRDLLVPLGFGVEESSEGTLRVQVPGFRSWDVTREVDLIEEVARRHGYDRFPEDLAAFRPGTVPDHPLFRLEDELRTELTGWGLLEAQTPAFAPLGEGEVEVINPVSMEERWLRQALFPALLRRLNSNFARGNRDVRLFELGTSFAAGEPGGLPIERTRVGGILHGLRHPPHWSAPAEPIDLWEVKGLFEAMVRRVQGASRVLPGLGMDLPRETSLPPLDPEASFCAIDEAGKVWAVAGRFPADSLDLPPWAGEVWGMEGVLPLLPEAPASFRVAPLPIHPAIERDLALIVADLHPAEEVLERIRAGGGAELREVSVFDVYRGPGVPEGHRSLAVRLRFRAEDRTLTDREVDEALQRAVLPLQEELGVRIRGG